MLIKLLSLQDLKFFKGKLCKVFLALLVAFYNKAKTLSIQIHIGIYIHNIRKSLIQFYNALKFDISETPCAPNYRKTPGYILYICVYYTYKHYSKLNTNCFISYKRTVISYIKTRDK